MEQLSIYLFHRNDRVHRIKSNAEITIRYFQHRRWQIVTLLEQLSGFWPYQSKLKQYPLQLLHSSLVLTIISATAKALREYMGVDTNMTVECCLFMFIFVGLLVKLILASIHQHSRQKIYEKVAKHFETMIDPEEAAILSEGAEQGFKSTLYYMCIISVVSAIFDTIPVLRAFYDYFFIHHQLRVHLPVPMNYGFDHREYWHIIVLDFIAAACSALLVEFTFGLSFNLQVRHVAALFKIVGIRMRKASELIVNEFKSERMSDDVTDQLYSLISSAIDLHSECFELVKLIEKSYTMSWFVILLLSTGGFGAGIHVVSTKFHDPIDTFRYVSGFMIIVLHFHMVFSQGQIIMYSSNSVSDACCKCKWYGLPKNSFKLLTIMIIRTSVACQLTGAKLFPLSMESFSTMLKAGLSYYTVFRSKLR